VKYCKNVRAGSSIKDRNYDRHKGLDNLRMLPWPLPENLVYSSTVMLKGGHDGLPIGDLNWYPEKRKLYDVVGIEKIIFNPTITGFECIPNPVKDNTFISFNLKNSSNVSLKIFNCNGEVVNTLVHERLESGSHQYNLNPNGLKAGLYFYTINDGDNSITKKFVLLK